MLEQVTVPSEAEPPASAVVLAMKRVQRMKQLRAVKPVPQTKRLRAAKRVQVMKQVPVTKEVLSHSPFAVPTLAVQPGSVPTREGESWLVRTPAPLPSGTRQSPGRNRRVSPCRSLAARPA